jgi:restriction endonuclease S subunit
MSYLELSEICEIYSGKSFPRKLNHDDHGDYWVLESHAVDHNGIDREKIIHVSNDQFRSPRLCLLENDILFRAKGGTNEGILIKKDDLIGHCVPTSYFLVLRIKPSVELISEFLVTYINKASIQSQLSLLKRGSTVQHITKTALMTFRVNIPPLNIQEKVIHLINLEIKRKALIRKIDDIQSQYIDELTSRYISGETNE